MKAKLQNYTGKRLEKPLDAIHEKCLDCSVYDEKEVKLCTCTGCPLWPFRFGTNPYRRKINLSEEEIVARVERLKSAREKRSS